MATVTGTGAHFSDGSIHVGVAPSAIAAENLGTNVSNGTGDDAAAYVLEGNQVRLIGTLDTDGALTSDTVLTLPSDLYPPRTVVVTAGIDDGGTLKSVPVQIDASGVVTSPTITYASGDKIYLDGISFEIGY
jgi:hypothetical protein